MNDSMLKILFAEHCAWHAVYIYLRGRKVFHFGFNPTGDGRPQVFGSVLGRDFRINLLVLRWRMNMSAPVLALYKAQQRVLHACDGRFGLWNNSRSSR